MHQMELNASFSVINVTWKINDKFLKKMVKGYVKLIELNVFSSDESMFASKENNF